MRRTAPLWLLLASACTAPTTLRPRTVGAPEPVPMRTSSAGLASATPPSAEPVEAPSEHYQASDEEPPDDEVEAESDAPAPDQGRATVPRAHPLDRSSPKEIEEALDHDPARLGSISLGRPSAGALFNGVQMPAAEGVELIDPARAWGTRETVDYLLEAIASVRARFPDTHPVYVGHISAKKGGPLRPHVSHQAGRDVDLSYFYRDDSARWYRRATAANLDLERTWALVRALVTETDVELILIDRSLQTLLREHALSAGEDPAWLASLFDGVPGKARPLIVHAKGHATHLHVRFYNPIAQQAARIAHDALVRRGLVGAPTAFVLHKAKKGETLGMLARKYGTTVREIRQANGLKSNLIRAKQSYRIPRKGKVGGPLPVVIPPRRLPPSADSDGASASSR